MCAVHCHFGWTKHERNHLDYYLNFMFARLLFISHTKILLITFVKWDFVCRSDSRLQVLSCIRCNVPILWAHTLRTTYAKMECLCLCNVHAIKCLEPHAIYHEDDTCVQTELKSSAPFSFCAPSLAVVHQTRSHYQCVYLHLHFISIPVFSCLISFPVVNITIFAH